MDLGAFSVSLSVESIEASREFYEKLGFTESGGDISQKWLILKHGDHVIGLFEGMFERNTLTFNPGWNSNAEQLESFADVREIQRHFKSQGLDLLSEVDESGDGPGSLMLLDPDGNPILIDQHV